MEVDVKGESIIYSELHYGTTIFQCHEDDVPIPSTFRPYIPDRQYGQRLSTFRVAICYRPIFSFPWDYM